MRPAGPPRRPSPWARLVFPGLFSGQSSGHLVLGLSVVYFLALLPFTRGLASPENLGNILSRMLPLLVLAIGQTFVLITGGIDLSVTAIIALSSVAGAWVMTSEGGLLGQSFLAAPAGVLTMLLVGTGLGLLNGCAVALLRMPPFMVTLTAMMFWSGLAVWSTGSRPIQNLPGAFIALGAHPWLSLGLTLLLGAAAHLVLGRTLFGRWLYAIGHSPRASVVSGVPLERTVILAYVVSGACAAAASILITGRLETGSPVHGKMIFLDVVGAAVIGGTSLFGGKGKVSGTALGALFITFIDNSLNLLGLSHFAIMMVKGGVILLAALIDALRSRILER